MSFIPQPGAQLIVTLPGEIMRCVVTRVIDAHTCFVEIGQPMAKSHNYRLGDLVACRRRGDVLGEKWEAFDEQLLVRPVTVDEPADKPVDTAKLQKAKTVKKPPNRAKKPQKRVETTSKSVKRQKVSKGFGA